MEYEIDRRDLDPTPTAVMTATLAVADIGAWLGTALEATARAAAVQGIAITGPPFARYEMLGGERFEVEAGFPTDRAVAADGDVHPSDLPGGPAAHATHVGPYDAMEAAYQALYRWIGANGGTPSGAPWEVYLTDPNEEPDPSGWRTEVFAPYAP